MVSPWFLRPDWVAARLLGLLKQLDAASASSIVPAGEVLAVQRTPSIQLLSDDRADIRDAVYELRVRLGVGPKTRPRICSRHTDPCASLRITKPLSEKTSSPPC